MRRQCVILGGPILPEIGWVDWGKSRKTQLRLVAVSAVIRTGSLPKASQKSSVSWDITSCPQWSSAYMNEEISLPSTGSKSTLNKKPSSCFLHAVSLFQLIFTPEDGSDICFGNERLTFTVIPYKIQFSTASAVTTSDPASQKCYRLCQLARLKRFNLRLKKFAVRVFRRKPLGKTLT